jgi:hypothetical protein
MTALDMAQIVLIVGVFGVGLIGIIKVAIIDEKKDKNTKE